MSVIINNNIKAGFLSTVRPYFANRSLVVGDLRQRGFMAPFGSVTYYRLTALFDRSRESYDGLMDLLTNISNTLQYDTPIKLVLPAVTEMEAIFNNKSTLLENVGTIISKCVLGRQETLDLSSLSKILEKINEKAVRP
jgi:hypothetical protein